MVIALTGLKSGRLSYFDQTGLVCPEKVGDPKHPQVAYSWEQLLELKAILKLREQISLQEIRQAIEFFRTSGHEPWLYNKKLIFINSTLFVETPQQGLAERLLIEVSGQHQGQLAFQWIDPLGDLEQELWQEAERNPAVDFASFKERAKRRTAA
ncbi:MerR family transcriptional regulator [Leptolyngbya sp. AN03gr2]|uniref:MerR family transcriptional regulator n=1 Tax=unclassified Leptolyngbya TaxID=2650499 RepID=UPI003D31938F